MLKLLADPQFAGNADLRLKVLMTSRAYPYIIDQFHDHSDDQSSVHFDADEASCSDKIKEEVNAVVAIRISQKLAKRFPEESDQKQIIEALQHSEQGTYLWLHLMLDELERRIRHFDVTDDVTSLIAKVPSTVEDVYCKMLDRVRHDDHHLAINILKFVVDARRPLTVAELSVAFAIAKARESCKSLKYLNETIRQLISFMNDIRELCGLLTTVHNHKVYLIHQTAREFLLDTSDSSNISSRWHHFSQEEAHATLAETCMKLLLVEEFEALPPAQDFIRTWQELTKDVGRLSIYYRRYLDSLCETFCEIPQSLSVGYSMFLSYSIDNWI